MLGQILIKNFDDNNTPDWKGGSISNSFVFKPFTNDMVLKGINALFDAPGLDILGFDRKLLRISANIIAPSLCIIFNDSINTQLLHNGLKTARVSPVFKNGEDYDINVY